MIGQVERVLLVLELDGAGPDDLPIRLRHLLKSLVRRFGLRCIWHQDCPAAWHFGQMLEPSSSSAPPGRDRHSGSSPSPEEPIARPEAS